MVAKRMTQNLFTKVLLFAIFLSLVVVVLGAYTRLSDAGLGCPDWPGCYGNIIPVNSTDISTTNSFSDIVWDAKAWKEMIHRYAASFLGLVILLIAFIAFTGKNTSKSNKITSSLLVFLVIFQGILGMLTVTELLHPVIVLGHLVGGISIVSLLFWLLINQNYSNLSANKNVYYFAIVTLFIIIAQIVLGGWTSTNYAALSCGSDFPTCLGSFIPASANFSSSILAVPALGINYEYGVLESGTRIAIQLLHRGGALLVLLAISTLIFLLKDNQKIRKLVVVMAILLILQLTLGILNIILSLPILIAVMHNLVALLLLLSVINIIYKLK